MYPNDRFARFALKGIFSLKREMVILIFFEFVASNSQRSNGELSTSYFAMNVDSIQIRGVVYYFAAALPPSRACPAEKFTLKREVQVFIYSS